MAEKARLKAPKPQKPEVPFFLTLLKGTNNKARLETDLHDIKILRTE